MYVHKLDGAQPYSADMRTEYTDDSPKYVGRLIAQDLAASGTLVRTDTHRRDVLSVNRVTNTAPKEQLDVVAYKPDELPDNDGPASPVAIREMIKYLTGLAAEQGDDRYLGHEEQIAGTVIDEYPVQRLGHGVIYSMGA